ncbi:MAG: transglutaminase domain-containing protein [Candidatus Omnitrophica bacterium]|nr:transglutaminase domain-containing protein [Candidatus Omnitrophota bacterium]
MSQENKGIRQALIIGIPIFIIAVVIIILSYLAYQAEQEGLRLGSPNISIRDLQNTGTGRGHAVRQAQHANAEPLSGPSGNPDNENTPGETSGGISENTETDTPAPLGFTQLKDSFTPSTLGANDKQTMKKGVLSGGGNFSKEKPREYSIKLSGDLAPEMFVFGIYNSMAQGRLIREGPYRLVPRGNSGKSGVSMECTLPANTRALPIQLPILINGDVLPAASGAYTIDKAGFLTAIKDPSNETAIDYSLTRRTRNAELIMSFPSSRWLKKEFSDLPGLIKYSLNLAKTGDDQYKMVMIATLFNKCFGYQRDILPIKLASGATWNLYLDKFIRQNRRLLTDCDVLSTYALIFTRYLGLKSAVIVGYNNTDPAGLTTLTSDKHHAALLVKVDAEWLIFDPTAITPDMSWEALRLSGGDIVSYAQYRREAIDHTGTPVSRSSSDRLAEKYFTVSSDVAALLGDSLLAGSHERYLPVTQPGLEINVASLNTTHAGVQSLYARKKVTLGRIRIITAVRAVILAFPALPGLSPTEYVVYLTATTS